MRGFGIRDIARCDPDNDSKHLLDSKLQQTLSPSQVLIVKDGVLPGLDKKILPLKGWLYRIARSILIRHRMRLICSILLTRQLTNFWLRFSSRTTSRYSIRWETDLSFAAVDVRWLTSTLRVLSDSIRFSSRSSSFSNTNIEVALQVFRYFYLWKIFGLVLCAFSLECEHIAQYAYPVQFAARFGLCTSCMCLGSVWECAFHLCSHICPRPSSRVFSLFLSFTSVRVAPARNSPVVCVEFNVHDNP